MTETKFHKPLVMTKKTIKISKNSTKYKGSAHQECNLNLNINKKCCSS